MNLRNSLTPLQILWALSLFLICSCNRPRTHRQDIWRREIKMAVQPQCGAFTSKDSVNFNAGINLALIKTIYSFGDSWSSNGRQDGSPASPAVPQGTNPMYGRRASNGPMWTENLASNQRTLKSYAIGGATVDHNLWRARATKSDMVGQVDKFLSQRQPIASDSSLATIFFGINDYSSVSEGPGTLQQAANQLLKETDRLIGAGLRQFIIVAPYFNRSSFNTNFNNVVWNGFKNLKQSRGIKFAYVDLSSLFTAIYANPSSFGYKSTGACLKSASTTAGGCSNPDDFLLDNHLRDCYPLSSTGYRLTLNIIPNAWRPTGFAPS
ncbi:hypothetical protein MJO28_013607 [Puccinia striiformis f. sp. tritici]|uniref:SGNH hydrolase-type esterase domain-containing protein n=3 Tax=Puccinia striiformis TaxID=27350 RepID=A0A2S4WCF1_9BASI|nr:hypothetical protein MJO28_013607 [Puccinia striiformis f. sp. tritici]POW19428.1 hypothetical protein PSHT_04722 [Puccinia striiformis]